MLFENSPPQHRQEIWNEKPPNQIEINAVDVAISHTTKNTHAIAQAIINACGDIFYHSLN